uniref:Uncharacterized protein n=1 Tax=Lactuca sativa TaxID=4236 RepID=A0A9R1WDF5_LACSA|nr:hypothetical protein LSAT_V11C200072750 [Lactuca sativa]
MSLENDHVESIAIINTSPQNSIHHLFLSLSLLLLRLTLPNPQPLLSFHLHSESQLQETTTTATTGDILTLLGTPQQAASIDPQVAVELQSCFNFIVPFNPTTNTPPDYRFNLINRLSQSLTESGIRFLRCMLNSKPRPDAESYQNELIWSPPTPVLKIAQLAFDSGGGPGFVPISLTPMQKGFAYISVADCEGSNGNRCELT